MPDAVLSPATCTPCGFWSASDSGRIVSLEDALAAAEPCYVLDKGDTFEYALGGHFATTATGDDTRTVLAIAPATAPATLGDPAFRRDHGLQYNYYAGAMANGIASVELVQAMGEAGMLGFFGAAGLAPSRIEDAILRLKEALPDKAWGCNLINSPGEPAWQEEVADLYIRHGVPCVEASAYISLSVPLIKYRTHGIHRDAEGRVVAPNRVIAKISRVEIATRFFEPPPAKMLKKLVESGDLSEEQAALAAEIPVAQDVTVEADSGGHTDHRAALAALPAMLQLRDTMQAKHGYACGLRVGLGGGVSTPISAAAAFAMGADYIMTGSVNQACVEAGTSDLVRAMLAEASQTDVGLAPAADMFEMGITVQVLKKGTRFVTRGMKLYEIYKAFDCIEDIPADEREKIEKDIFRAPLDTIWAQTEAFFAERDPRQLEKAAKNPKFKMALVFRWYLGQSSSWANAGIEDRQEDFQIWCGPAMGAFNDWVRGSFLESPEARHVVPVAHNILAGAAAVLRAGVLRRQGIVLPPASLHIAPREDAASRVPKP